VALTSFGDHFSVPRHTFPDIMWRMSGAVSRAQVDSAVLGDVAGVGSDAIDRTGQAAGRMLLALREGPLNAVSLSRHAGLDSTGAEHLLALLAGLGQVRRTGATYRAAIPVFGRRDSGMVAGLVTLRRSVMTEWLGRNYDAMRRFLERLSAVRAGVPNGQAFTQIWHYVFGITNRQLIERGIFAHPYIPAPVPRLHSRGIRQQLVVPGLLALRRTPAGPGMMRDGVDLHPG